MSKRRRRRMTHADYEQWENLPHHIVRTYFSWAYSDSPYLNHRRFRRRLDYDDLVQEAMLGLLDAWDKYDHDHPSGASFITYAFRAIYRRVGRFIDYNSSPLTTTGWQKALLSTDDSVPHDIATAIACQLFSERQQIAEQDGCGYQNPGAFYDDGIENIEKQEWIENCMRRLRNWLTQKEMQILKERFEGKTFKQIGQRRGYTRENARRVVSELMVKAAVALYQESRDDEE